MRGERGSKRGRKRERERGRKFLRENRSQAVGNPASFPQFVSRVTKLLNRFLIPRLPVIKHTIRSDYPRELSFGMFPSAEVHTCVD